MPLIGASNSLGGLAGSNAVARLLVVISGQSSQLEAAVARSEGSLQGLSRNASSIGKTLTRSLTLPLLAIGGLAIKAASDFETSFGRVLGLSTVMDKRFNDLGLSADGLRQSLLDMANDPLIVATPKDLADALYFAGSAGLKASQAMEVVRLSAEGASIGMGDAADISKVLIFALTNFAPTGLTAAKAMDVLTAAVQEGTAAPDELAIALGRLLPIAREAGVTFEETVASIAALSNLGVPTRVATTSMRALLAGLLAPTQAATKRLDELGISADDLRTTMSQGGLIATFQILRNAVHGDENALHDIIPTIRGFTAFTGLSTDQAKRYSSTLNAVQNSAGKFRNAIEIISRTPGFKLQKAFQQLQVAAINLGEALLPVFLKIIQVVTDFGVVFSNMPGIFHTVLAAAITLGAAVGPILQLFGAMTQVREVTLATGAAGATMVPTWKAIGTSVAVAGAAAAIAAGGFMSLMKGQQSLFTVATTLVGTFIALTIAIKGLQTIANLVGPTNALTIAFTSLSTGGIAAFAAGVAALGTVVALAIGSQHSYRKAVDETADALYRGATSGQNLEQTLLEIKDTGAREYLQELAKAMDLLGTPAGVALPKLESAGATDFLSTLTQINNGVQEGTYVWGDAADEWNKLSAAIFQAAQDGSLTTDEFNNITDSGQKLDDVLVRVGQHAGETDFGKLVQHAQDLGKAYPAVSQELEKYNQSQQTAIAATQLGDKATADYAKQLGVSSDYLSGQLQHYGISALNMSSDTKTAFETAEGWVHDNSAKIQEQMAAIDKAATDMSSSLLDSFDPFGDIPKTAAPAIDKVIAKMQKMGEIAAQESANIVALNKRGVPTSLIEKAIGAGPGFVARLSGATDAQLRKIVTAYEVNLGLMDKAVLAEGAHQEIKGKNMVEGFAIAMMTSSHLPQGAARNIVKRVTDAFASGDLKPAAFGMVTSFVNGLGRIKGMTDKKATEATDAFVTQLLSGDAFTKSGKLAVDNVAAGMAQELGVPKKQARNLLASVTATLRGGDFTGIGAGIGNDIASGLSASTDTVVSAANQVMDAAKAAMVAAGHKSPKYFTYYMGTDMISQMYEGMAKTSRKMHGVRPKIALEGGLPSPNRELATKRRMSVDLDVTMDRDRVGRQLAYEAYAKGY